MRSARSSGRRAASANGRFAENIVPVTVPGAKGAVTTVSTDEHPRADTTLEGLAKLRPIVRPDGTVTAGNASGVNDGAAAMILASAEAVEENGLTPVARILGMAQRRRPAAHHGHRPGAGGDEALRAARPESPRTSMWSS